MINDLKILTARAGVNQIRGITVAGSTGAGIPAHVTDLNATVSNASVGSTSTVTVTFRRDPTDTAYSGVKVWVKGYQGNQTPTLIASGTDSPITTVLNNTGELLGMTVQASGNGGSAPIETAPTTGLVLPKSASGGTGTSSSTGLSSVGLSMPGEFTVTGSPRTSNGTIVVGKTSQSANTVFAGPTSGGAVAPTFRAIVGGDVPAINLAASGNGGVTGLLPVANGGSGTATPSLVAGTNITVTGSWPNQTVNASAGGGETITASNGRLLVPFADTLTTSANYQTNALAANAVWGFEFEVYQTITIGHMLIYIAGAVAASNVYVGLADMSGNILVQGVFSGAATGAIVGTMSPSSYALTPGSYYFVWGSDTSSASLIVEGYGIAGNLCTLLNGNSAKRLWFKTSQISSGAIQNISIAGVSTSTIGSIPWCLLTI